MLRCGASTYAAADSLLGEFEVAMMYLPHLSNASVFGLAGSASALAERIVDGLCDAVIAMDAQGLITLWNQGATRLFGWSRDEMLGQSVFQRAPTALTEWLRVSPLAGAADQWEGELVEPRKDGSHVWCQTRVQRLCAEDGSLHGFLRIARPVPNAVPTVGVDETLAGEALDVLPEPLAVLGSDGTIRIANQAWRRLCADAAALTLGAVARGGVGSNYLDLLRCDSLVSEDVLADLARVLSGESASLQHEYVRSAAHSSHWFRFTATALDRPERGAVVTHHNITDRVLSQQTSQQRNERLQLALEAARMGVWSMEPSSQQVAWSPEASRILGRVDTDSSPSELCELVHPQDRAALHAEIARSIHERSRFEGSFRIVCSDRSTRWLHTYGQVQLGSQGLPERVVGTLQDISDVWLARRAMVRQHRVLQRIASGAPLADALCEVALLIEEQLPGVLCSILVHDRANNVLRTVAAPSLPKEYNQAVDGVPVGPNRGACGTAAFRREAVLVRDTQTDPLFAAYRDLAAKNGLYACLSVPVLSRDLDQDAGEMVLGTFAMYRRDVEDAAGSLSAFASAATYRPPGSGGPTGCPLSMGEGDEPLGPHGRPPDILTGAINLARFAIARQAALQELKDSEERFRLLVDGVADYALLLVDPERRICTWNSGAARIFGYSASEVLGRSVECLSATEDVASGAWHERWIKLNRDGRLEVDGWRQRKNGSRFWGTAVARVLHDVDGKTRGFALVVRDLTERRRLEDQLRQSQKMDAIGRLAGGIAHDFNNLLMIICGYSELLLQTSVLDDAQDDAIKAIRDAAERATEWTGQLLAFSRKAVVEPKLLNLDAVARATARMLERLLGEDVHLTTSLSSTPNWVKLDPGQLDQVLMNLAVNARDAMPQGGELRIETSSVELAKTLSTTDGDIPAGAYAQLVVTDTGAGIPDHVRPHIFEPFFTTKNVGSGAGTGLGLATVYGIVRQAGGGILVDSTVGHGTTFRILLPRVPEVVAPAVALAESSPGGNETLLLVEDEDSVRQVVRLSLAVLGYKVLAAASVDSALGMAAAHAGPIHALLTDVVMPDRGGRALAEALCKVRPQTRVLYMSGYTDAAVLQHGVEATAAAFIQKPFSPQQLARKLRDLLDTSPSESR